MLILSKFKEQFITELSKQIQTDEALSIFHILAAHFLGFKKVEVILNYNDVINEEKLKLLNNAQKRLVNNEPVQYVIGKTDFYGLSFIVNRHTLIPRPETEELVEWILKKHPNSNYRVLDIGTGSGCIAISLAKNLAKAEINALDISKATLQVAKKNAITNAVEVNFIEQNILDIEAFSTKYDIVVSNPPYVRELEKKEMHKNVLDYEPKKALFVTNEDPLIFYRKIALLITKNNHPTHLYFEINEYLSEETIELISNLGFTEVTLKNDFREKPRMLYGLWNGN